MDSQVPRKRPQWTSKDWWQEVLCEEADGEKAMDPMRLSSAVLYHKKTITTVQSEHSESTTFYDYEKPHWRLKQLTIPLQGYHP